MAQSNVYSLNIVGYVNVAVPQGFSIVSNPLDDGLGDGNIITNVLTSTNTPVGSQVFLFSPAGGFANTETFFGSGFNNWFPGTNQLSPGAASFLFSPVATNITFVGQIAAGNYTNALAAGTFNLVGSIVPESLPLGNTGVTNTLQIPASPGDEVFRFSTANFGGYNTITFFNNLGWFDPTNPSGSTNGPALGVGEGVFLLSTLGGNWVQTFTVN
jgi:hypothetical protein